MKFPKDSRIDPFWFHFPDQNIPPRGEKKLHHAVSTADLSRRCAGKADLNRKAMIKL